MGIVVDFDEEKRFGTNEYLLKQDMLIQSMRFDNYDYDILIRQLERFILLLVRPAMLLTGDDIRNLLTPLAVMRELYNALALETFITDYNKWKSHI